MEQSSQYQQFGKSWYESKRDDKDWHESRNKNRADKRRDNKKKAVEYKGAKCFDCGQSFPDCCYDFHHLDPTQVNDVPSSVLHCSWKRIVAELDKCVMLCSNCHRIRHNQDGYVAHKKRYK